MKSIRYFKRILPVIIAVASTVTLWSCRKDSEQVADPYVRFGGNMQELYYDAVGGKTNIDIFTNVKDWRINIMYYTSEESWIDVFDNRGNESGRVTVTVGENGYAGGFREAEIQVVDKTNFVFGSLKILQRPTEAYLELDMNGITSLTMLGKGGEAAVKVRANVPWEAKVVGGSGDWIDFTGQDVGSLNLNVARKGDAGKRSATIRLAMIGTGNDSNFVDPSLRQLGSESYFENAEKKSVAELISHIDAMPGGAGVINDNYYLEAFVTSDRSRKNTPGEAVFVQDDSGRGMQLLFNADDNDFALNDKLVIQLIGATAIRETGSESLLVNMPGKVNVNSRESSQGIAPVVLDNFAQIDQYENTLVTVNPIEFVIPMGTYMNAQESSYGPLPAEDERALPLGDTPRETGIIMRDSKGQTVRLYSSYVFTDKVSTTIQPGSGALTGIVMKRAIATLAR